MLAEIRSCAINLLAMREHTKFELQHKLEIRGFAPAAIAKVVAVLEQEGLQSDQRFIENYIVMRCRRGFGPIRIKMELNERGVDKGLIEHFLQDYKSNWQELAQKALHKKFGNKIPNDLAEQTKQMKYLYYKGFAADLIRKLFRNV
jgi:regulatory protein